MRFTKRKQQPIFSTLSERDSAKSRSEAIDATLACDLPGEETKPSSCEIPTQHQEPSSQSPIDLVSDPLVSVDFVYVAPGTFLMGSDEDEWGRAEDEFLHQVTLTKGFFLQATLVTQRQWRAVMGATPSCFSGGSLERPVDGVSWLDCKEFLQRLNAIGQQIYRLPTEAEWEYACRAGSTTALSGGDLVVAEDGTDPNLELVGWYFANANASTHPVAEKMPNPWGFYDMHGNLCEWCVDWYGPYPKGSGTDPVSTRIGSRRVCRGGCWASQPQNCRSATRFSFPPGCRSDFVGLRLVRGD